MAKKSLTKDDTKKSVVKKRTIKYKCFHCDNEHSLTQYYLSYSPLHHHIPICKACLKIEFAKFVKKYNNIHKAILKICATQDIYYYKNTADDSISKMKDDKDYDTCIGHYMKTINSLPQFKNLTYEDSDISNDSSNVKNMSMAELSKNEILWGKYEDYEYEILNAKYKELEEFVQPQSPIDKSLMRDVCRHEYACDQDPYNAKKHQMKTSAYKSAGLDSASRMKNNNNSDMQRDLGVRISMIEKYRPADLYNDVTKYKDIAGIEEYEEQHTIRAMRNMIEGTKDFESLI